MTEVIIKEMSQVTIDEDMLKQVDMQALLDKFRRGHSDLDMFQTTRKKHEERGVGKKIWDLLTFDKTMENAQLSATQIQAEFSKTLGQLMVVNVALSQHLNQQQKQLSEQQYIIKDQTQRIEQNTSELSAQHEVLAKQNSELDKLVTEYFELRGLTQDGAKKLISIANEIQHARDDLLNSMEKSQNWIAEQQQKTLTEISLQMASFDESTQRNVAEITKRCEFVESENSHLKQQLSEMKTVFLEKNDTFDAVLTNERNRLDTHIANTEKSFIDLQEELNIFREKQQKKIEKLTIIFGITSIGLMSTVAYLFLT